jgi:hypothetical protein
MVFPIERPMAFTLIAWAIADQDDYAGSCVEQGERKVVDCDFA